MTKENETMTFHNESAISRISLWANIIGFTILIFSLLGFAYDFYNITQNWEQVVAGLPTNLVERIAIFASKVFLDPFIGVFYFLVLRGISQLLNLGLDLFYGTVEVEIEEEETVLE